MQCTVERAAHCIHSVHTLYRLAGFFRRNQSHCYVNPADYKYPFVQLHFTCYITRQPPVAGIDVARLQKCPAFNQRPQRLCNPA